MLQSGQGPQAQPPLGVSRLPGSGEWQETGGGQAGPGTYTAGPDTLPWGKVEFGISSHKFVPRTVIAD